MARTKGAYSVKIDMEQVEKLAAMGCTQQEMARWFGCGHDTIERRLAVPENRIIYARAVVRMKVKIRQYQLAAAATGDPTMLIWLGKQYLGQKDKIEDGQASERPTLTLEECLETAKRLLDYAESNH